jgi:tRNA-dihydrouridine synthase A
MVGRQAYHHPAWMALWDAEYWPASDGAPDVSAAAPDTRVLPEDPGDAWRVGIEAAMVAYMQARQAEGVPWAHVARHILGLWNGRPGARRWRRVWSDHRLKALSAHEVAALAREARVTRAAGRGGADDEQTAAAHAAESPLRGSPDLD